MQWSNFHCLPQPEVSSKVSETALNQVSYCCGRGKQEVLAFPFGRGVGGAFFFLFSVGLRPEAENVHRGAPEKR